MSTLLPVTVETMPRVMVLDPPLTDAEFEAEKKGILNGTSGHAGNCHVRTDGAEEKPQ